MTKGTRSQFALKAGTALGDMPYLAVPFRSRSGLQWVRCGNARLHPPRPREHKLLTSWLERPEVYGAFGYSRPITRANLEEGWLPDLTLPPRFVKNERGYGEPAEFLAVSRLEARRWRPVGLCTIYEHRGAGDPVQEVDFALPEVAERGSQTFVYQVQMCVFGYLFAVCGAHSITWQRRRAPADREKPPPLRKRAETGAAENVRITTAVFRRRLQRRGACKPIVCLQR